MFPKLPKNGLSVNPFSAFQLIQADLKHCVKMPLGFLDQFRWQSCFLMRAQALEEPFLKEPALLVFFQKAQPVADDFTRGVITPRLDQSLDEGL